MLYTNTLEKSTLTLLTRLMHDAELASFFLVGGTALALQLGHRKSIDLDLFSQSPFDAAGLRDVLQKRYCFEPTVRAKNTLKGVINGVAIDCITYAYPLVQPFIQTHDGIRIASMEDIAAMKLSAIVDAGTRPKDFVDIAVLSHYLPLTHMIRTYEQKYHTAEPIIICKALNYHADIVFDEDILLTSGTFSWEKTVQRLEQMTREPDKTFPPLFKAQNRTQNQYGYER